jgi:hypothetical protein
VEIPPPQIAGRFHGVGSKLRFHVGWAIVEPKPLSKL